MEQFELIRRDYYVHKRSIRQIARIHGVHRRTVRQAIASAIPPARRRPQREPPVLTKELRAIVDSWLEADRDAPRKQRHTARRIHHRLRREHDFIGAESTVRKYVGRRRRELGLRVRATVPLTHLPGEEGEVDWYEAQVDFPDGRRKVQILQVRACFSGREFHIAFPRQTQQAFLEGMAAAFSYFGGVFHELRFDNLPAAVRRVLRGRRRQETQRFIAFRSHYLFESVFCVPGEEGAHEKGGVEGGVGRFRRNHLVPVPKVAGFHELNRLLLDGCAEDDQRSIEGRTHTVLEDWDRERDALLPLRAEPFPTADVDSYRVDSKSRVRVRNNFYSVPVRLVGRKVEVRVHAGRVQAIHEGQPVADHPRLYGVYGEQLDLDHYLELLRLKPGAMARSRPLRQAREGGRWPADYDGLWQAMTKRFGVSEGTRQMVDVLLLHREAPADTVHCAVSLALEYGGYNASAVAMLLRQLISTERQPRALSELGRLAAYSKPARTDMSTYDKLLGGMAA